MRLSPSASVSSPQGGSGHRLGTRTRKKHKRLDAICEDVFNQNHTDKIESNEGTCMGDSLGNDSELRRSSRVRRAPVILDSSPPPPKKRRKINKLGKKIRGVSGKKLRVKGKLESEGYTSSSENSDDEELGVWRSRLRSSVKKVEFSSKGSRNRPRGKRKLFQGDEEDDKDIMSVKDGLVDNEDGEKSMVLKPSIDNEEKLHDDHSGDRCLENGTEPSRNEDDGDSNLSAREKIDGNEDIMDDGPVQLRENDNEAPTDIPVQEKHDMSDSVKDTGQNDEPLNSSKSVEDLDNDRLDAEIASVCTDPVADQECNDEVNAAETEVKDADQKNDATVENHNAVVDGFSKPWIKEGRRCGLCGCVTDGKPPKRLVIDSAGSDHEVYSGSSASEDFNYDAWDGFGEEPGWLGRLLGPINDRYGIVGIWVHQQCAVWSPEVYFAGLGCLKNVRAALCRGRALKCTRCGRPGATLGCRVDRCPRTYHLPCARASGCIFDHRKFLIACADHRYLFQPQGHQYVQHIKKLKAKKMTLEMRRASNDASRKDIEAEEKWMEKCGEDEEFLRRETKRLQRDLSRIAPVYIGGCHSEGENLYEGWESVAGLQDVIKCMKEVVILPLLYPEFFENMGITPPRGVLLHGYPGTGKTLVVRSLIGSCARGEKRIAYFARKGADCLGKYVGDAERQLRLLFQVAERSQPSIIFFDEIDGLAPVRTRQQDQTHSSVVSTLLALMDGLKSRGSVIVIGATNRPDAVDPALRRPGRFDREIYFPLPSIKDRAAILALHTRKWPKPVAGPLLEWIATKTVGFAGADLQALCAQAAVIALKRNCSWKQILSSAENNNVERKRPPLPPFTVEERDWLEALSLAPPPCSRREAGMAASEVVGSPLPMHLIPCLLQPLLSLIISLYIDDHLWLPPRLVNAGAAIKRALVSLMERRSLPSDRWWFYAPSMVQESSIAREIARNLYIAGILDGDASFSGYDLSNDGSCDDSRSLLASVDFNPSGPFRNLCYASSKKAGYKILIAGDPKAGQKHLASCLLHCFVGSVEMQKIDLATISQEGHGDMEQGISHIIMKCANMKFCAVFMPRIDLWAIQSVQKDNEALPSSSRSAMGSSLTLPQSGGEGCSSTPSKSESVKAAASEHELRSASQAWKSIVEQLECICVSSSLVILATSELPCAALPSEVRQFFGGDLLVSEGSATSKNGSPRFTVEVNGYFDQAMLIHSSALDLTRNLIQQFIHFVHHKNHMRSDSAVTSRSHYDVERDESNHKSVEELEAKNQILEGSITKRLAHSGSKTGKGKSTLALATSTFGCQILTYPHFAELCWITSKLKEGPSADVCGPWKGWPFNSCIVHPCKSTQKEAVLGNSNNVKGKDKFTLVRGLMAVGLSAYRGKYVTPTEVSLQVRKVLELLVVQIGARIQSGKDRYQFIRLLSQVAYLEDMVNNWAHSLRSLEPDAQTIPKNPGLPGAQSGGLQTPADNPVQLGEKSNFQGNGFQEPELMAGGGLQGASLEPDAQTTPMNSKLRSAQSSDGLQTPADSPVPFREKSNFQGNGFQGPELIEGGLQGASLEPDAQTTLMHPELPGAQASDGLQTPADDPVQLEEKSNFRGNGFQEPELTEGGLQRVTTQCSVAANFGDDNITEPTTQGRTLLNEMVFSNHTAPQNCVSRDSASEENASSETVILVNSNPVPVADLDGSVIINQSCVGISSESNDRERELLRSKPNEDHAIVSEHMQFMQQSDQFACPVSLDQLRADTCNSGELHNIEIHRSHDIYNESNEGGMVEIEISAESRKHVCNAHVPDLNLPSEAADTSLESEVVCAYSCCFGCVHTLHQLMKNLVTQAWELSGSSSTIEGAHDLVSSLSTTLCLSIRNLYISGGCSSLLNGELRSETCGKISESQETGACNCQSSENFTKLVECACHQGKDFPDGAVPSFYDQQAFIPRYIFRDGVLIVADPDSEPSFHCKYDKLCLCSLIDLTLMKKQPSY